MPQNQNMNQNANRQNQNANSNNNQQNQPNEQEINVKEIVDAFELAQSEVEKWGEISRVLSKCAKLVSNLIERQEQQRQQKQQNQQNVQNQNQNVNKGQSVNTPPTGDSVKKVD